MAGRLFRVFQLGKHMKSSNWGQSIEKRVRTLSTTPLDDNVKFIKPGFDFGHPPFGPHYGSDVTLGRDGLPLLVDWTEVEGAVWPPQNQEKGTGHCYVFSALGAAGSLSFMKNGKAVELSAQQVLDCNTLTGGFDDGGFPQNVFDFMINCGGIVSSSLYPYTGQPGVCKPIRGPGVTIDDWKYIEPNNESALKYAVAHQPVVVNIQVDKPIRVRGATTYFTYYRDGVIYGRSYSSLNHSALLVGYGETISGELFWLLLNSYGLRWGIDGKFLLARGTGQRGGALGVLRDPMVPLKWSPNKIISTKCESCGRCLKKK